MAVSLKILNGVCVIPSHFVFVDEEEKEELKLVEKAESRFISQLSYRWGAKKLVLVRQKCKASEGLQPR